MSRLMSVIRFLLYFSSFYYMLITFFSSIFAGVLDIFLYAPALPF